VAGEQETRQSSGLSDWRSSGMLPPFHACTTPITMLWTPPALDYLCGESRRSAREARLMFGWDLHGAQAREVGTRPEN
jgi:hypothetical protein